MAGKGKKSQKLGPRVTVLFGQIKVNKASNKSGKGTKNAYVYVRKATADFFGIKETPNAVVQTRDKKNIPVRGSSGAGSIKIPVGAGTKAGGGSKGSGKIVYKRIPVPTGATITTIRKFIQTFSKNKPASFVTKDGRTWPVGSNSKAKP